MRAASPRWTASVSGSAPQRCGRATNSSSMSREHALPEVEESLFMVPSCLLLPIAKAARRLWCRQHFYRLNALLATAQANSSPNHCKKAESRITVNGPECGGASFSPRDCVSAAKRDSEVSARWDSTPYPLKCNLDPRALHWILGHGPDGYPSRG